MTRGCPARRGSALTAAGALAALLAIGPEPARAQAAAAAPPLTGAGAAMLATIHALTGPGMNGRAAGTPGGATARAWIEAKLKTIGAAPLAADGYAQPFTFVTTGTETVRGTNLVAVCPAADGTTTGPVIVVSAHYDHLGIRAGETFHGADDNASGVALLLLVAERCVKTPLAHPLVLAAFDAEEHGLQGAKAFVAHPPLPLARVALAVNFDMVSRSERGEIYVAGPGRWPRLRPLLTPAVTVPGITVRFGHDTGGGQNDWTNQSDHGAFHQAGIPFVYFGVEDHADYHRPTDTAEKIAPAFLDRVAAVVLASLAALDRVPDYK